MMYVYNPAQATISTIVWDGNLTIPTGRTITSVDTTGTIGANLYGQMPPGLGGIVMGGL